MNELMDDREMRGIVPQIISDIGKFFPRIKKYYLDSKRYFEYLWRKKTKEGDYPDLIMKEWKKRGGEEFDLKNPVTYTQKIQWAEIYDKFAVRSWIKEEIGEDYLIPLIGVYSDPKIIDFNKLPNSFVIKMNNASGFNIIVKDKASINESAIRKQLAKWLKINYAFYKGFQPHYLGIVPKILIEEFVNDINGELRDYKFLCFNDEVKYCWVDIGRYGDHCRNVYDLDWNLQPWTQSKPNFKGEVEKPKNFDEMIRIASILCKGFSHVRVDLYNVDGKIFFGEMTFSNGGGHDKIIPTKYDRIIGDMWHIGN